MRGWKQRYWKRLFHFPNFVWFRDVSGYPYCQVIISCLNVSKKSILCLIPWWDLQSRTDHSPPSCTLLENHLYMKIIFELESLVSDPDDIPMCHRDLIPCYFSFFLFAFFLFFFLFFFLPSYFKYYGKFRTIGNT